MVNSSKYYAILAKHSRTTLPILVIQGDIWDTRTNQIRDTKTINERFVLSKIISTATDDFEYPLVSIVTPVYNGEKYIAECIESVLSQDYPNLEYIIINDGSTDRTAEVVQKYASKLIYIEQANQGQVSALNHGWQISKGKYLTYLSSDDKFLPEAISSLVTFIESEKEAIVVFPDCDLIDANGKIILKSVVKPFDYRAVLVNHELYIGVCPLFRRTLFETLGGWRESLRLANDRDFWLRAANHGKLVMYPKTLGLYRTHATSMSYSLSDDIAAREHIGVIHYLNDNHLILPGYENLIPRALANASFFGARVHFRAGRWKKAHEQILEAKRIDPEFSKVKAYLFLFKYGLGLTLRRAKHFFQLFCNRQFTESVSAKKDKKLTEQSIEVRSPAHGDAGTRTTQPSEAQARSWERTDKGNK